MLNRELKRLSQLNELFKQKTPLGKLKIGFKIITRAPLDECKDLFWLLNESLHSEKVKFSDELKKTVMRALNGEGVKLDVQKSCYYAPDAKLALAFQLATGGHLGQKRKGMLERDYVHHVIMVWYYVALCGGSLDQQIAALLHDYAEDVKDRSLSLKAIRTMICQLFGKKVERLCFALKNKEGLSGKTPEKAAEKHAWQLNHLKLMDPEGQLIKMCDRDSNKYDMHRDGPASNNPQSICKEMHKRDEFAAVCHSLPPLVQSFSDYVDVLLRKKYCI